LFFCRLFFDLWHDIINITENFYMTSLEGLIRELFFRPKVWRKILFGSILCYLFIGYGYIRQLVSRQGASAELPAAVFDHDLFKRTLAALPLGAFYTIVPLFIAWGVQNLLTLCSLGAFVFLAWGLGVLAAITLTAVALVVVEEDAERFFLGLEFEKVLSQWWRLKHVWALPGLACYGFIAIMGVLFYGLSFFVTLSFLVVYIGITQRNLRYA